MSAPIVTVIIPAYNAEATLDETLRSVRAQTYADLEIIVVDDGSLDATGAVAEGHARQDRRVRLLRLENAGVAAARNRTLAEASGRFVAPIDADDLWSPLKIEKQVGLLLASGEEVGLVYTWQARLDRNGRVISTAHRPTAEGWVLRDMLRRNVVGSGSVPLMRMEAVLEAGGYDSSLRANAAEGCEDLKLYRLISERYRYAVVRDILTGYRKTGDTMSSRLFQMLRSFELVAATFRRRHPGCVSVIDEGCGIFRQGLVSKAVQAGDWRSAAVLAAGLIASHPGHVLGLPARAGRYAARAAAQRLGMRAQDSPPATPFLPCAAGTLGIRAAAAPAGLQGGARGHDLERSGASLDAP